MSNVLVLDTFTWNTTKSCLWMRILHNFSLPCPSAGLWSMRWGWAEPFPYIVHCNIVTRSHYNIIHYKYAGAGHRQSGESGELGNYAPMSRFRPRTHRYWIQYHDHRRGEKRVWPAPTVSTQPGAAPAAIIRRVQWIVRAYHLIIIIITVTRCDLPLSLLFITLPIITSHGTHVDTGHTSTQFPPSVIRLPS